MSRLRVLLCFALMATCFFSMSAWAQSQASTGQIAGTVKDAAGAVITGAKIKVTNIDTGFTQTMTSGENGLFRAVLLPPGRYKVTANNAGFAEGMADNVQVGIGRTVDLNFVLTVGARKEEVTVSAETIEVTRNEAASFVNSTIVANMPLNGRKFQDLALLTPSAQVEPSRQQISMVGQRGINSSLNIDGSDYGNPFFGGLRGGERSNAAPTIPQEAIQEFQMVRAGYSAEFGRSTGGIMTAITKSGTNAIHGSVGYNIRHQDLSKGNEFFDTATTQLRTKPGCSTCTVVPAPTLQQWSGAIGGPIKKDKLFYFGSYTQQRNRIPRVVLFDKLFNTGVTPSKGQEAFDYFTSLQGPYQQTNDALALLLKSDYQFSENHRLSVKYGHSRNTALNATTAGTAILPTVNSALSNNGTEKDSTQTGVIQLSSFFGKLANDLRTEYTRETRPRLANAQMPTVNPSAIGTYGTVSFLGQNIEKDWRFQVADTVSFQTGTHLFKFGVDYSHLDAFQLFGFNQNGVFNFGTTSINSLLDIMSIGGTIANRFDGFNCGSGGSAGACVTYLRQIGNLKLSLVGEQVASYIQDSWRIRPSLTINYGLRWEASFNPQPDASNEAMVSKIRSITFPVPNRTEDPTKIPNQVAQLAPRLGFAWDPRGNGKTVVRAFSGIYYAATPLLTYAGPVNNLRATPGDLSIQLPYGVKIPTGQPATGTCSTATPWYCASLYQQLNLIGVNLNNYGLDTLPILTVGQVQSVATALGSALRGSADPFFGAQPIFVDSHYHNPRSYQAGFGVEREVAHNWSAGVDVAWVNTVFLERNLELNLPMPTVPASDPAQRPFYGLSNNTATRPISSLGSVQVRDSSARSLYRGITFSSSMRRKWGQFLAYYTLSETTSYDDNERDSGGIKYENWLHLSNEYGFSDLDRKHQLVFAPVFYLPKGFEVSSSMRFATGAPLNPNIGFDANGDKYNTDHPYWAPGVPFTRNAFRNLGYKNVDLRVQKAIKFTESKRVKLSAEMFNLFNLMNLTYSGSNVTNYCVTPTVSSCGIPGQAWTANPTFLKLRDPSTGQLLTNNSPGQVFQMQFSARFEF